MKLFYSKLTKKKFKFFTIGACFIGDIVLCLYIWLKFSNRAAFDRSAEMAKSIFKNHPSLQGQEIPHSFFNEIFELVVQMIMVMVVLFIIIHIIVYLMHLKEKKSAHVYLKTQAWFMVLTFGWIGISQFGNSLFESFFIVQAALYFLVARGMDVFPFPNQKKVQ